MKEAILNYHKKIDAKYLDANVKRFEWVDIAKGILIILVVVGHASSVMAPYIYLFHIPMFFLLAGYVERLEEKSMIQIFVQKAESLLVPYFAVNVIYLLGRVGLNLFGAQGLFYDVVIDKDQLIEQIILILKVQQITDLGGATWYLFCLFVSFLLAKLFVLVTGNKLNFFTLAISGLVLCVGLFLDYLEISLAYYIDIAFVASFYLVLGGIFKKYKIFDWVTYINWKLWLLIFVIYCYIFSTKFHATVDWASRQYGNCIISIITVLLASIILMNISKSVLELRTGEILTFFGRESLALMLLHFVFLRLAFSIVVILDIKPVTELRNLIPLTPSVWDAFYIIFTLLCFVGVHFLCKNLSIYKWFFEGKIPYPKSVKEGKFNKYSFVAVIMVIILIIGNISFERISHKIALYSQPYYIDGLYEDNFIGKEMQIIINNDAVETVSFQLYKVFEQDNECTIYVDEEVIGVYDVINELTDILIPINCDDNIVIRIVFRDVIIPKDIGLSEDGRELSVILVDGKIKIQ